MKLTTTLLATTALTVAAVSAHAQDMANSLTLVSWGGAYQNSQQKAYVEPCSGSTRAASSAARSRRS